MINNLKITFKNLIFPILFVILIYFIFLIISILLEINKIVDDKNFYYNVIWGILSNIILVISSLYFIKKHISPINKLFEVNHFYPIIILPIAILVGLLLYYFSEFLNSFMVGFLPALNVESYYKDIIKVDNKYFLMLSIIEVGIITGFSEEIFLRGLCYKLLRKKLNIISTIIVNTIIFVFFHPIPAFLLSYIISNVIICIFYERFKIIWIPILIHITVNIISVINTY